MKIKFFYRVGLVPYLELLWAGPVKKHPLPDMIFVTYITCVKLSALG